MHRCVLFLTLALTLHTCAEDASDFQQKGIAALKESQSNPKLIVEAARNFAKAAELFEKSGDSDRAVEMNSYLYWCKKKMTLQDMEAFIKGGETTVVASLKAVEEKKVEVSEAQKWFERAEKFANARPDEHLLIAVRFFEIADRFKEVDLKTSTAAMDRSLKEMQAVTTDGRSSDLKSPVGIEKAIIGNFKLAVDGGQFMHKLAFLTNNKWSQDDGKFGGYWALRDGKIVLSYSDRKYGMTTLVMQDANSFSGTNSHADGKSFNWQMKRVSVEQSNAAGEPPPAKSEKP